METADRQGIYINIQQNPFSFGSAAVLSEHDRMRQTIAFATKITFETLEEGRPLPKSSFISMPSKAEQSLMDGLWKTGVRPSSPLVHYEAPAGEIVATQKHLDDMRTIVSHHIAIGLPGIKNQFDLDPEEVNS